MTNNELDALIVEQSCGAAILAQVEHYLGRFVAYPSEDARVAHTLWIAHAHMMDAWESTPRIGFLSPEPGSGKTRALEATEPLVPNPVEAVNVSPAYLFRKVGSDDGLPTILFDEIDTVFGPKAKENEELRGLLNAGHRRSGVAGRCVVRGKTVETEEIPAYCAVALAGLHDLPDTIRTRTVVIRMRRRAPGERVEPYRRRLHQSIGHALRDRLAEWAAEIVEAIGENYPELPPSIVDRDADVWEPLVAIADAAGADWSERARKAAVALVIASRDDTPSLGIRLLATFERSLPTRRRCRRSPSSKPSTDLKMPRGLICGENPWMPAACRPFYAAMISARRRIVTASWCSRATPERTCTTPGNDT